LELEFPAQQTHVWNVRNTVLYLGASVTILTVRYVVACSL